MFIFIISSGLRRILMMKKCFAWALLASLCGGVAPAKAEMAYLDEVRALGAVAGQGLACGAAKYDTFEMLAMAILISKAPSDNLQAQAMYAYNEEKANAYLSKQYDGMFECAEINARFDNQGIFEAVLYADGTIKMPDGKIITPRQAYDARQIYNPDKQARQKAQKIYDGGNNVKVGEISIKPYGNEKDVQTVYAGAANVQSSVSLPESAKAVSASSSVEANPSRYSQPVAESSVGHIKSKW